MLQASLAAPTALVSHLHVQQCTLAWRYCLSGSTQASSGRGSRCCWVQAQNAAPDLSQLFDFLKKSSKEDAAAAKEEVR